MRHHTDSYRYPSPAKINLFLRVLNRRIDGYHELQTAFQFIDLCDWLTFRPNLSGKILCHYHNEILSAENDLIYRAARLLQAMTHENMGVEIALEKNIPMGGGLGGGSSNAATTLLVLNHLWHLNIAHEALMQMGKQLGADVPIFIHGQSVFAEGIGDIFSPLKMSENAIIVICPRIHIATQTIFTSPYLHRNQPILPYYLNGDEYEYLNDCTDAIFKHFPEMQIVVEQLMALEIQVKITGTGSCVFFEAAYVKDQAQLITLVNKNNWCMWQTTTQTCSKLYQQASNLFHA